MPTDAARLLLAVPKEAWVSIAVERALPGVRSAFVADRPERPYLGIEAILVGNFERVLPGLTPADVPELAFVQTVYTGLDGLPFHRFPPGAKVAGNVGGYAPFVAEHAVALLLAPAHDLPGGMRAVAAGELRPTSPMVYLGGQRVFLVGYGAIAREIAGRLSGFGARCSGVHRSGEPRDGVDRRYAERELPRAVADADLVIDCLPLPRATRGRFDASLLSAMRPNAIFVNVDGPRPWMRPPSGRTSRPTRSSGRRSMSGGGRISSRVASTLPSRPGDLPNLLGSPHRAGLVPEARPYVLDRARENLGRYFRGEAPRYLADPCDYG